MGGEGGEKGAERRHASCPSTALSGALHSPAGWLAGVEGEVVGGSLFCSMVYEVGGLTCMYSKWPYLPCKR